MAQGGQSHVKVVNVTKDIILHSGPFPWIVRLCMLRPYGALCTAIADYSQAQPITSDD
jgi:hypothetical protein